MVVSHDEHPLKSAVLQEIARAVLNFEHSRGSEYVV
jgi:hypothetical protein